MRKRFWIPLVLLIGLVLCGFYENETLELNSVPVASRELPETFDGFLIAQVSDLHNARFGHENEDLLVLLRQVQPDIIAITGDLIDSQHTDMETALAFAEKAAAIAPCYFVTGNHEAWTSGYGGFEKRLEEADVTVLRNQTISLERDAQAITLAGIDDPAFLGETPFQRMLEQLSSENYTILLSHRPEYFSQYCEAGFDLVLSGHAHGGQFRLPWLGGLVAPNQGWFPEYDSGLYTSGGTTLAVSRGLGNSVIPIRLNNPPEVLLITLYHQ